MEFPYVDGRIFMRQNDGINCWDLRAVGGGDSAPPTTTLRTVVLRGGASANTTSVKVERREVLDRQAQSWKASVDVPRSGKTVEVTAQNAAGVTKTTRIVVRP